VGIFNCEVVFFCDPVVLNGRTTANDDFGKDMKGGGSGVFEGSVAVSQEGLM
jgi:hypothetical protein